MLEEIDALFAKDGWHLEHKLVAGGLVESGEGGSGKSSPAEVAPVVDEGKRSSDADVEAGKAGGKA